MPRMFHESEGPKVHSAKLRRTLFCLSVTPALFEAHERDLDELGQTTQQAFADLHGRFGVEVLGTFNDDEVMVGPSSSLPWTSYILADTPSYDAVTAVTNLLRTTELGPGRLWKYIKMEARIGQPLFFASE